METQQAVNESEIESGALRRSGSFRGLPLRASRPVVREKEVEELLADYEEALDKATDENVELQEKIEQMDSELVALRQELALYDQKHKRELEALKKALGSKDAQFSELQSHLSSLKPQLTLTDPSADTLQLMPEEKLQSIQHTANQLTSEPWHKGKWQRLLQDSSILRSPKRLFSVSLKVANFFAVLLGYAFVVILVLTFLV